MYQIQWIILWSDLRTQYLARFITWSLNRVKSQPVDIFRVLSVSSISAYAVARIQPQISRFGFTSWPELRHSLWPGLYFSLCACFRLCMRPSLVVILLPMLGSFSG